MPTKTQDRQYLPKKAKVKFNGGRGALLCEWCDTIIREDFDPMTIEDKYHYCGGDYCKLQNNCKGGWVFPDRCRYNNRLGCDCGAYPPQRDYEINRNINTGH